MREIAREKGFDLLKEKVLEFKNPRRIAILYIILSLSLLAFIALIRWIDCLRLFGAMISQLIVAAWLSVAQYYSMRHLVFKIFKGEANK